MHLTHPSIQATRDQFCLNLAVPSGCALSSSLPSAMPSARRVNDASSMIGLRPPSRAIVQTSGWIRSPLTSNHAVTPHTASSLRVPVCLSCLSGHGESSLQGYFRSARSFNLIVSRQEGTHYLLDIAMADALPCSCAVRLSLYSKGSCSRQVNDASRLAKLLTRIRAIRWIRPLAAPTHAIPPRTASSRRLGVQKWDVPCCVATERACGKDTSQACRRGMFSCLGRTTHMRPWQVVDLIAHAGPCSCAGRFNLPSAGSIKRLLTTSRAMVQVSASFRPPVAWAHALPPSAASSYRSGAAPGQNTSLCGRSEGRVLQEGFTSMPSRLLALRSQAGSVSSSGIDLLPHSSSARLDSASAVISAKQVCDASCISNSPATSRAIVQVSGWSCPPITSDHDIPLRLLHVCVPNRCAYPRSAAMKRARCDDTAQVFSPGIFLFLWSLPVNPRGRRAEGRTMHVLQGTSRAVYVPVGNPARFAPANAIPPAAASLLPPGSALVCFSVQRRYGGSLLQGYFRSMRSWLPFVSLDFAIADALPFCAAMTSSFFSAGLFGRHVRDAARMAGLLTTSTAIVLASSWIRSPVASASAVSPFAARLLQVSACFCFPYNSGQRSLQGYFRSAWSWNLVSSVQEGTHCLLDVALADALPCSCAVRFSHLTAESRASKTLRDASCMASRVVTHVWGWIHPPLASAYVIPPFVPRAACDKCKRQGLEGFIRLHHSKQLVPVVLRHAHECGSEFRKLHEISGAVHGAVVAISRSLHPVQAAPQKDAVPRSSGCSTLPPPMMGTPQPPSPSPSAACLLRLQGALRSVFRPDIEAAVEANCLEVSPVEETLRLAQVPFILMIRNLLPLLPSQALQDREVLLNLVMVGHSHGGVIAHSLAQRLEAVGLLVKGIVAVDTLALPRMTETPLPRFDPQALFRHLSPYHWQLTSSKVNMMAPEVPWRFGCTNVRSPICSPMLAFAGCGGSCVSSHSHISHFGSSVP